MEPTPAYVNAYLAQSRDDNGCPICYDDLLPSDFRGDVTQKVHKTACGKLFHTSCLQNWLTAHNTCPSCTVGISFEKEVIAWKDELYAQQVHEELGGDISTLQDAEKSSKKRKADFDADAAFARKLQEELDGEAKQADTQPEKKKPRHLELNST